jgi:hypothetical protein
MELVKRDPLYVVVEAEEKELFHSIIDIERRIQDINASIKGLIDHKVFLEHELQVKKRKQDDCRRKKEHSSKVCKFTLNLRFIHTITHSIAYRAKLDRHGTKIPYSTLRTFACWNPSF